MPAIALTWKALHRARIDTSFEICKPAIDASNEPTILNYKPTHFRSCYTCEHDERSYRDYKTIYSCNVNSFIDSMMIFGSPRALR